MKHFQMCAMVSLAIMAASPAMAETPNLQWGSDTRAMSQPDCLNRAKFAMGEQGLSVSGGDGSHVSGAGPNVAVLVTCISLGQRTFIDVVGASPDPDTAGRFRNGVRSLVMGPPN